MKRTVSICCAGLLVLVLLAMVWWDPAIAQAPKGPRFEYIGGESDGSRRSAVEFYRIMDGPHICYVAVKPGEATAISCPQ